VPSQARGVSVSKLAASNDDLAILLGVQRTGRIRSPCTVL
jgi:hypothetical protein